MTEQDKQALIKHFCSRDCGEAAEGCMIMPCHEIELIQEFPTTDTDSDTISRQAVLDALNNIEIPKNASWYQYYQQALTAVGKLPPAQPEIIYCKDCTKHNKKIGFDENFHTVWKEDACPLVSWRGKAQGHEFDYQFCAYAKRREVTT